MNPMLLSLGAALLGAAILTTGAFLLISGQRRGRQVAGNRSLTNALLGGGMVAGGLAVIIAASYLWPDSGTEDFDPNQVLREAPPAAVPSPEAPPPAFRDRQWLVLSWGTPSDTDEAQPEEEAAFSAQLAELANRLLQSRSGFGGAITTSILARADLARLYQDPDALQSLCVDNPGSVILTLRVEGSQSTDAEVGYVPWRQPEYQLLDCRDRGLRTYIGRAVERRGDDFPYQQALAEDLGQALAGMFVQAPAGQD